MKDVLKILGVLLTGLLVAVLIYPFLHESGHALFTIFSGAELHEFHLLPIPYVVCNVYSTGRGGQCLIGIAGMLFPFLISFLIRRKNFWFWLTSLLIKGISALSFSISYLAVLCYETGIILPNEDIVRVIQISETKSSIWLFFSLVMLCLTVAIMHFEKPFERFKKYFEI